MTSKEVIKELKNLYKQHKNDTVEMFAVNWAEVCYDSYKKIEELNEQIEKLKEENKILNNKVVEDSRKIDDLLQDNLMTKVNAFGEVR